MRYATDEMRHIWSEENKRLLWRQVWVALAKAEHKAGLVSKKELDDIVSHAKDVDIAKSKEREEKVYHELMSEIQVFSEQCKIGGGKIHLGATSADILDSTTTAQVIASLALTKKSVKTILQLFAQKIETYQDVVCMGYTHLQPAEPTTLSYRLSFYAQDLLMGLTFLEKIEPLIKTKGMKGAVGTSASYENLLEKTHMTSQELEQEVMQELGLQAVAISHQTYPRLLDAFVIEAISNIATSLHKFCFDFRIMQSANFDEWIERRSAERVGSSAMPFKRNPDKAEKVCSLCRYIISLVPLALNNPANSLLERTLDDSAAQRIFLPEAFLALDECLKTTKNLLDNFEINPSGIQKNLSIFGQFSATEPLLMALVKRGANRQKMHEIIKSCSMKVWQGRGVGKDLSLFDLLSKEKELTQFLSVEEIQKFSSPTSHIGLAKKRTQAFLKTIQKINKVL